MKGYLNTFYSCDFDVFYSIYYRWKVTSKFKRNFGIEQKFFRRKAEAA